MMKCNGVQNNSLDHIYFNSTAKKKKKNLRHFSKYLLCCTEEKSKTGLEWHKIK